MKESDERIRYITEYLIGYKQKIEALNKNGLFDAATLYELFAKEVCSLWFSQKFLNLNSNTANFPYVDLISDDKKIYVQVSTVQDIPGKIKKTLEKIRDAKSAKISGINQLFFFVLGNESLNKIKDYSGVNKIGNIDFIASEHIITIDNIIEKAKNDISFQQSLYNLLYKELELYNFNALKLNEMSNLGKSLISKNIDNLINNEYEINREEIVERIKKDNHRFISILGDAGVGKSALCKKILLNEELVLYARAEKFTEVTDLDNVWGMDISRTLKYLNGKKIVFFIDALEFIADGKKTKIELLQQLYELGTGHKNVFIITSCRTYDKTAFVKLDANYSIQTYQVPELTDKEIILVANKYPLIKKMWRLSYYTQLLRMPFYINLIVSKIKSIDNITDINELRNHIWQNVICLKNKQDSNNILKIRDTINFIVFTRAKSFSSGISSDSISSELLILLLSEGVIIESERKIRLKYDIFEDICFENFFDEKFDNCKGDFENFFSEIENLGRCVYRRYQIWIENKLFAKNNREKFLYKLITTNTIPETWKQQTIIGIVKSRFCTDFFDEYANHIIENNLEEFLKTINIFSFETKITSLKYGNSYTLLNPVGYGRSSLIKLLRIDNKYKNDFFKKDILKLCSDYAKETEFELETATIACEILEYFIESMIINLDKEKNYSIKKNINEYLTPIYLMAEYSNAWIKIFWEKIINDYKNTNNTKKYLAEEVMRHVLKNTTPVLAKKLSSELCLIAEIYWIYISDEDKNKVHKTYKNFSVSESENYGLNKNAEHYSNEFKSVNDNTFFWMLASFNYFVALGWAIKTTNYVVDEYKKKNLQHLLDIEIKINELEQPKKYIGTSEFWLVGIKDYYVHELIGDIIYILKQKTIELIKNNNPSKDEIKIFAELLKKEIYEKSNNIIMFTIIEEIGRQCSQILPGYAIELASSIEIIMWDIQRISQLFPDSIIADLQNQILLSVGIPYMKERYTIKKESVYSIQDYVRNMQLCEDKNIKLKAENILDYLYSKIPNDSNNAQYHLQIQKMDLRNAEIYQESEKTLFITPKISGEAEKLVNEGQNSEFNKEQNLISNIINKCNNKIKDGTFMMVECLDVIDKLNNFISSTVISLKTEEILIMFISYALTKFNLDRNQRSRLCKIWIEGINKIFKNNCLIYKYALSKALFKQIEEDIEDCVLIELKKLILDIILYNGQQGIILEIANYLKDYLPSNQKMATSLFNTIVMLSKDKMDHYIFNANYIYEGNYQKDATYIPNRQRPLHTYQINEIMMERETKSFESKRKDIISKYLLNEEKLEIINFDINCYDITTLCYVANCGLNLKNATFHNVIKEIVINMIDIWYTSRYSHEFLETYSIFEIVKFFQKELTNSDDINLAIDLLFVDVDYSKFDKEAYEFYEDIMSYFIPVFFDAYKDALVRNRCIKNIKNIEKKLLVIKDRRIKNELSKIMFLTTKCFSFTNWNELVTKFSYSDKCFLNDIWSKYGKYHLTAMFNIIYNMHIDKLLPEILISVNNCFDEAKKNQESFRKTIKEVDVIINMLITKAFLDFNDDIKQDNELTQAYENILKTLVNFNYEAAAVILDEFRIH